jgi:hypothetical protein
VSLVRDILLVELGWDNIDADRKNLKMAHQDDDGGEQEEEI